MDTGSVDLKSESNENSNSIIVVTGARGVVGRQLIDHFSAQGHQLRVLSRNPKSFSTKNEIATGDYQEMDKLLAGAHAIVHLAARNNDQGGSYDAFEEDNINLTLDLAVAAKEHGVRKFIFASTTKALSGKGCHYGKSKAIAEQKLLELDNPEFRISIARLCPVYGNGTRGKIKFLQNLPWGMGGLSLWLMRSFVPIVSAERVAKEIEAIARSLDPLEEVCISNPIGRVSAYGIFASIVNCIFVILVPTLLAFPCVVASIAVAATSKGGVLFLQNRIGHRQRPFLLCKFRTMFTGTPNKSTHEVGKSYVTKVGALLRVTKMDELPQAWNVLRRELNLIGPRPCLQNQTELIRERIRYGVFKVIPGITGYGQVAGVDMSEPKKLAIHDHRYAAFRGILLDIQIAIKTVLGGGFGDPVGGRVPSEKGECSPLESPPAPSDASSLTVSEAKTHK